MNTQQLLEESERSRRALLSILEDQKLAEEKLLKSEAYNRLLFNSSPIGLALCKMDGSMVDVNPAYAKIIGRTVEETLQLTYWDITPNKYADQEKQQLKSLEETGRYGPYEKEYIHKDGHLVPVRLQGLIIEQQGERFIWSSVEDISAHKQAEIELSKSYEKAKELEIIINKSPAVAFLWPKDRNLPVEYVSENILQFGYTQEEILSGKILYNKMVHPEDVNRVNSESDDYARSGVNEFNQEYRIFTKSGEIRYVEDNTWVRRDNNNNITNYQGIILDITERKRAEERLRISEEKFSKAFRASPDAITMSNFEGIIIEANEACLRHLGYDTDELIGYTTIELNIWANLTDRNNYLQTLREHGRVSNFETQFRTKTGQIKTGLISGEIIEIEGKKQIISIIRDITERKRAEEKIKESEETYRNLFQNAQVGLFRTRISDGKILESNEQLARMFGYNNREDFIADYVTSFNYVDPGTRERMLEEIKRNGYVKNLEARFYRKDHTIFYAKYSAKIFPDKGWIEGVAEDITEQKRAEDALRESEARYRRLHESMNDSFAQTTMSGEIVDVNRSYIEMLGYTEDEIRSLKYQDVTPARWHEFELKIVETQILPRGYSDVYEKEYIRKDGTIFPVELRTYLLRDTDGNPSGMWAIVRDITERKRVEEEIRQRNKEMEIIDAIIKTTTTKLELKKILDTALEGALALTGLEGGTLCLVDNEKKVLDLSATQNTSKEMFDELNASSIKIGDCLCGKAAETGEPLILWDDASGSEYATHESVRNEGIKFHAAFPLIATGKTLGVLCVFARNDFKPTEHSLSMLKELCGTIALAIENAKLYQQTQEQAKELELKVQERTRELQIANKELEAFSYSVSHDLRAPLRAIDGFSLALLEDYSDKLDSQGKQFLQRVRNGATEMAQLIDDLLNLSHISRRELVSGTVDLSELIKSITDNLSSLEPKRKVQFEVAEKVFVKGDRNLLKIALENLLNNAWKFTSKKKNTKIEFGVLEKEGKNVYYIKDNGVGFDMKYADKLFNPFQRLHRKEDYPGTGIGLATVKRIISKHSGSIWAESELGKGTTFYFTL